MRYLKALAATIVLIGLVFGVPIGLTLGYGNPARGFTEGLVTDTTILDVVVLAAWAFWVQMTLCFALEIVNQIRGLRGTGSVIALPAFGPQADLARMLVGAVLAVGVIGASAGIGASRASATPAASSMSAIPHPAATAITPQAAPARMAEEVVIQPGDSLWKLAETHLGDGAQWRQIADLNHGRELGRGVIATTAILQNGLQPGWRLLVPARTEMAVSSAFHTEHVVEQGETLSEIAQQATGRAANWPRLYDANRAVVGDNPNLIYPGEELVLPHRGPHDVDHVTATTSLSDAVPSHLDAFIANEIKGEGTPAETNGSTAGTAATPSATHADVEQSPSASEMKAVAPWLVGSLLFTGGILAGHLQLRLRERRRDRFRARRPGRAISVPSLELAPLEKTVTVVGGPHSQALEFLDLELRRLGRTQTRDRASLPRVASIELTDENVIAHLTQPAALPEPWTEVGNDQLRWFTPIKAAAPDIDPFDTPAPYPLLATIGHDERGHWWLLNLEQLGVVTINGDPDRCGDLMRYVAAELAIASWSRDARIDLIGIGAELEGLDSKLHLHSADETDTATRGVMDRVLSMIDRTRDVGMTVETARVSPPDDEVWEAQLLVSASEDHEIVATIIQLIGSQPNATASAVVQASATGERGIVLDVGIDGTVRIEKVGLTLTASQLPAVDAAQITDLYQRAADREDSVVPVDEKATTGWHSHIDAAGNLRRDHTVDRSTPTAGFETTTMLTGSDAAYLERAAVVEDDLDLLAPRVTATVSAAIRNADPHLEDDLQDWSQRSNARPWLRLLGQVKAVGYGEHLDRVSERVPYFSELLAYLWTRSQQGATLAEIMSAFPTLSEGRLRTDLATLRGWLGANTRTGVPLLPSAHQAPARAHHHKNVYQVDCGPGGILVDVDLLRRLRASAQAEGGPAGIARMASALIQLVDGQPFSGLRGGGWSWMLDEGDRIDEHMVVAISDMAHLATTHYLAAGDVAKARVTADIGLLAAPFEETMRLDLVAVKEAEGDYDEAAALLNTSVFNRSDDGLPPRELSERTHRILKNRSWE
ncbi:MAG: hypothetical protein NVSMB48_00400 [Marmoricola sp.]